MAFSLKKFHKDMLYYKPNKEYKENDKHLMNTRRLRKMNLIKKYEKLKFYSNSPTKQSNIFDMITGEELVEIKDLPPQINHELKFKETNKVQLNGDIQKKRAKKVQETSVSNEIVKMENSIVIPELKTPEKPQPIKIPFSNHPFLNKNNKEQETNNDSSLSSSFFNDHNESVKVNVIVEEKNIINASNISCRSEEINNVNQSPPNNDNEEISFITTTSKYLESDKKKCTVNLSENFNSEDSNIQEESNYIKKNPKESEIPKIKFKNEELYDNFSRGECSSQDAKYNVGKDKNKYFTLYEDLKLIFIASLIFENNHLKFSNRSTWDSLAVQWFKNRSGETLRGRFQKKLKNLMESHFELIRYYFVQYGIKGYLKFKYIGKNKWTLKSISHYFGKSEIEDIPKFKREPIELTFLPPSNFIDPKFNEMVLNDSNLLQSISINSNPISNFYNHSKGSKLISVFEVATKLFVSDLMSQLVETCNQEEIKEDYQTILLIFRNKEESKYIRLESTKFSSSNGTPKKYVKKDNLNISEFETSSCCNKIIPKSNSGSTSSKKEIEKENIICNSQRKENSTTQIDFNNKKKRGRPIGSKNKPKSSCFSKDINFIRIDSSPSKKILNLKCSFDQNLNNSEKVKCLEFNEKNLDLNKSEKEMKSRIQENSQVCE